MQKKAVRNFVCSFLFSLLVVGIVSKVCFRAPVSEPKEPKNSVPTRTISLFSAPNNINNQELPIDKADIDISAIEALDASSEKNSRDESSLVSSEQQDTPSLISGDIQPKPQTETAKENQYAINMDLSAAEEIVLEKENVVTVADKSTDYEKSGIVYADISDTLQDEQKQSAENENNLQLATVIYEPDAEMQDNASSSLLKPINVTEKSDIVKDAATEIALNDTNTYSDEIPLFETSDIMHDHVEVAKSASASEIAMLEPAHLVSNIENIEEPEEKTLADADLKQNEWKQMSETKEEQSPWVVAKGNKFAKNKIAVEKFAEKNSVEEYVTDDANSSNVETDSKSSSLGTADISDKKQISSALNPESENKAGKETQVAYQMIPNLLIPIPEDIANDPNLTPQLSISPEQENKPDKTEQKLSEIEQNNPETTTIDENDKQSGLFKSITSWFSSGNKDDANKNTNQAQNAKPEKKSSFNFFGMGGSEPEDTTAKTQILPAELRLSFQPNRAEISGQTLKWIHAFADNARDNADIYIEVRIDGTSSFALQKKRLNLLSTIFANRGVDFRKINIVFTSREPNSFIIRNIRFNNTEEVVENKDSQNSYYRPW